MIKVAAITPGLNIPSSRFRIRQYINDLQNSGIAVKEFPAKIYDNKMPGMLENIKQRYIFPLSASYELIKLTTRLPHALSTHFADATWLNRTFYNALDLEGLLKRPLFFDIDDAIWIHYEKHISKIASRATAIMAGNNFIAEWASKYNQNIYIIPTAIDTSIYSVKDNTLEETFTIGWSGTAENMKYLYQIEDALASFIHEHQKVRLLILTNKKPELKKIRIENLTWIKWDSAIESSVLKQFDVGLMPLENSEWAQGKCSFKMLQYMSCGIPVIVSPVGMNAEVLNLGDVGFGAQSNTEWYEALSVLYKNHHHAKVMGNNGRKIVEQYFSRQNVAHQIVGIFEKHIL